MIFKTLFQLRSKTPPLGNEKTSKKPKCAGLHITAPGMVPKRRKHPFAAEEEAVKDKAYSPLVAPHYFAKFWQITL